MEFLLEKGAKINVKHLYGMSPLTMVVKKDNLKLIQMLLGKGAKATIRDRSGLSPLDFAKKYGNQKIVKMLGSNEKQYISRSQR